MKRAVTTYFCDLCGFSSVNDGEMVPYSIHWLSLVKREAIKLERHYCEKCHRTEVQPMLIKEAKT